MPMVKMFIGAYNCLYYKCFFFFFLFFTGRNCCTSFSTQKIYLSAKSAKGRCVKMASERCPVLFLERYNVVIFILGN